MSPFIDMLDNCAAIPLEKRVRPVQTGTMDAIASQDRAQLGAVVAVLHGGPDFKDPPISTHVKTILWPYAEHVLVRPEDAASASL